MIATSKGAVNVEFYARLRTLIDTRLADERSTPDESKFLYWPLTFIRSSLCWGFIWSGLQSVSPFNTDIVGTNGRGAGTLITPQHVVMANHFKPATGKILSFIDQNSVTHTRTLSAVTQIGTSDICVGLLDAPIASILPCKILPDDWQDFFTSPRREQVSFPILNLNQFQQAVCGDAIFLDAFKRIIIAKPSSQLRRGFWRQVVNGDSGQPFFAALEGQLILLGMARGVDGTSFYGDGLGYYLTELQNAIASLGGDGTLSRAVLT